MAGMYSPSTTFYSGGVYTISSNTTTPYFEIQNSMGGFLYAIVTIYMQCNTAEQLIEPLTFRHYNVDGNITRFTNVQTKDPYQYQNSLFFKPVKDGTILDGRTNINFNLLPSETVNFIFFVLELSNDKFLKEPSFFDDYFFKSQYEYLNGFTEKL